MISTLAPCIAVIGPANSGKTTLLHQLDEVLQRHRAQPLACVVKGTPDGTGRYLLYSPELREVLKPLVKGKWIPETAATVCAWIANARAHLDLVLLDFGGRYGPGDDYMLQHCSHFLVLARSDLPDDAENGARSWIRVAERNGLAPVARLRSLMREGEAAAGRGADGVLEGTFRADASGPGDPINRATLDALLERLLSLAPPCRSPSYFSLKLARRWQVADLADLAGRGADLARLVDMEGEVVLGGVAPSWAYAAAMHRALDRRPEARVHIFDPKVVGGLVEIPGAITPAPDAPLGRAVKVAWTTPKDGGEGALRVEIATEDRMLAPLSFQFLPAAPLPPGPAPEGPLWICGAAPIWLHLTYSRWLRRNSEGRVIGQWDAGMSGVMFVSGPSTPRFEKREFPASPSRLDPQL